MKNRLPSIAGALAVGSAMLTASVWLSQAEAAKDMDKPSIARGRYLVQIAGCNDCHTPGYAMSGGNVPEKDWLVGDHVGWKGAWGTTYPANLRLVLNGYTEDQWVKVAKGAQYRPPMPWFALRDMSEDDLRAMHRYVRSLGAAGQPAPAYVPPTQQPAGPFVQFPEPPAPAQKAASR